MAARKSKEMFRQVLLSFLTIEDIAKVSMLSKEFNLIVDVNKGKPKDSPDLNLYLKPILSTQFGEVFDDFATKSKQKFRTVKDLNVWFHARAKWQHKSLFFKSS